MQTFIDHLAESALTSLGFFWKAAWAFVLGYAVSAMIQAFVPKAQLTRYMGQPSARSVALATGFGAVSSSCSFAALATARALVQKGAHFIAAVAFMFASTNLVIELGILILIFLGWPFLVAEIIGGLVLVAISSLLIRLTYPQAWVDAAREKVEGDEPEEDDFDWRRRLASREGWRMVGRKFGMEWGMVWQEVTIGFTLAGLVATFVPDAFWQALFLNGVAAEHPGNFLIALENAAVAPFVTAATFIGSMGNIPLATILTGSGVLFGGVMGFIYSDLMVPPLVKINAKYYGWRIALYIAAIMYASIVATALILHYAFLWTDLTPESTRQVEDITQFKVDYTLFLNIAALGAVGVMVWLARSGGNKTSHDHHGHDHEKKRHFNVQTIITWICFALLTCGGVYGAIAGVNG